MSQLAEEPVIDPIEYAKLSAKEKLRLRARKSYLKHREEVLQRSKEYYVSNKEKRDAQSKAWRENNLERTRELSRARYKRNPEIYRKRCRDWHWKNIDKIRAQKKWKKYPHITRNAFHKRRALLKKASVNLRGIQEFMRQVHSKSIATCYYCQEKIPSKSVHFDHIVPLSKGGQHSVDNLCVSCEHCNCTKWAKPIQEWIRFGQQILPL